MTLFFVYFSLFLSLFLRGSPDYEVDFYSAISKMHSIVIGPGLGRTETAWNCAKVVENMIYLLI